MFLAKHLVAKKFIRLGFTPEETAAIWRDHRSTTDVANANLLFCPWCAKVQQSRATAHPPRPSSPVPDWGAFRDIQPGRSTRMKAGALSPQISASYRLHFPELAMNGTAVKWAETILPFMELVKRRAVQRRIILVAADHEWRDVLVNWMVGSRACPCQLTSVALAVPPSHWTLLTLLPLRSCASGGNASPSPQRIHHP